MYDFTHILVVRMLLSHAVAHLDVFAGVPAGLQYNPGKDMESLSNLP